MAATPRKRLTFHYKGFFDDGSIFIDSTGGEPMSITVGYHETMPMIEEALLSMCVDEEKTVNVGKGYGEYDEKALQTKVMRFMIPHGDELQEGQEVMWTSPSNPQKPVPAKIVRADEFSFDIDFNHPLAGKELVYWLKLVSAE